MGSVSIICHGQLCQTSNKTCMSQGRHFVSFTHKQSSQIVNNVSGCLIYDCYNCRYNIYALQSGA